MRLVKYLFGSGPCGTVGGGDSQPGGGFGGIGVSFSGLCGGRKNKSRETGGGGLEADVASFIGGSLDLEDGGGAKGLLRACPISISRTPPPPLTPAAPPSRPASPPPSLLTESMSFILAAKINSWLWMEKISISVRSGLCFVEMK